MTAPQMSSVHFQPVTRVYPAAARASSAEGMSVGEGPAELPSPLRRPAGPLKGEVLFEGPVPAEAIVTTGRQVLKGLGFGFMLGGAFMKGWDLGKSLKQSFEQGSPKPFLREATRQATTWGMALDMGATGGAIGFAIGGPVGAIAGGIIGGAAGAISGYIAGSWLADLF